MDEWEDRKSIKQDRKYKTGHTYRRLTNRKIIEFNTDQIFQVDSEIHKSLNKSKNWLNEEKIAFKPRNDLFDVEFSHHNYRKLKKQKVKERKENELFEPTVTLIKDRLNNQIIKKYTYMKSDKNKNEINENETSKMKPNNKVISRKQQRKLESLKESNKILEANKTSNQLASVSFTKPLMILEKGKCWKSRINEYLKKSHDDVLYKEKNYKEKVLLAKEDQKYEIKNHHKIEEITNAENAMNYIFLKFKENSNNKFFKFEPLIGDLSFVKRETIVSRYKKDLYSDELNNKIHKESDGFYICSANDWKEAINVCDSCNKKSHKLIKLDGCEHEACEKCWKGFIKDKLKLLQTCSNNQYKLTCFYKNCITPINLELLSKILTENETKNYIDKCCNFKIANSSQYVQCQKPECNNLLVKSRTNFISVCECNYMICGNCKMEAHFPLSCEEAKSYNYMLSIENCEYIQSNMFLEGKWCPKCSNFILKNGGCDHIRCFCTHDFCWACLGDYEREHRCKRRVRTIKLSLFSFGKIINDNFVGFVEMNNAMIIESSNRLRCIEIILTKLRGVLTLDNILWKHNNEDNNDLIENNTNDDINIDQYVGINGMKLIYFFLKKISFDIEQFNVLCKCLSLDVLLKEGSSLSDDLFKAMRLINKMHKMYSKIQNWKQLNELLNIYKTFIYIVNSKLDKSIKKMQSIF